MISAVLLVEFYMRTANACQAKFDKRRPNLKRRLCKFAVQKLAGEVVMMRIFSIFVAHVPCVSCMARSSTELYSRYVRLRGALLGALR